MYEAEQSNLEGAPEFPAGHALTVKLADVRPRTALPPRRLSVLSAADPRDGAKEGANDRVDRLHGVFEHVVEQHVAAGVLVGLLSYGGLGSTLGAALASRRRPVRAASMAFADSAVDERAFGQTEAQHIGSEHDGLVVMPDEITQDPEWLALRMGSPPCRQRRSSDRLFHRRYGAPQTRVALALAFRERPGQPLSPETGRPVAAAE
jgi:asparagine synthetase B (glutamine-hydrolysing)